MSLRANAARVQQFRGFTLVELAVTLLIVTMLIGGLLIPLQTQVENRKIEDTQQLLEQAREALLGYAASHGYFPCPAVAASAGQEPAGTDHAAGACGPNSRAALLAVPPTAPPFDEYVGFLPAALLGFSPVDAEGFALDAWGGSAANRIRYAVTTQSVSGILAPFTMAGGMASAGIPAIASNSNLLYVCGSGVGVVAGTNCGAAPRLASNAVAVVWSSGANAVGGGTSADEAENPNANSPLAPDRIFVSRVRASGGAQEFDDHMTWISGFTVVSRLVASGQLP